MKQNMDATESGRNLIPSLEELILETKDQFFDHEIPATKYFSVADGTFIYDLERDGALWPVRVPERIGAGGSVSITVEYAVAGTFAVELICVSGKARPQIRVDSRLSEWDIAYRENDQDRLNLLEVEVPAGKHVITITNAAYVESWLHIRAYHFGKYLSGRYRLMVIPPNEKAALRIPVDPATGNRIRIRLGGIGYQGELHLNGHYLGSFAGPVTSHLAASARYVKDIRCEYDYYIKPEMTAGAGEGVLEIIIADREDTRYLSGPCILQSVELSKLSPDFSLPVFTPKPIEHRVRIAPNKRYFYLENGQSYFPVGITLWSPVSGSTVGLKRHNVGPYWCENDPEITYRWLEKLAAHGMNNIRIVTASTAFIRKIGEINMEKVELLDEVIRRCRKLGLYVVISLEDHFNLWNDSEKNPSPFREITRRGRTEREQRSLFFSDPVIRKEMVNFARCLAERYKDEKTVMAYELMDEVWFSGHRGDPAMLDYHRDLAKAIRSVSADQLLSTSVLSWTFNGKIVDTWVDLLPVEELDFHSFEAYEDWGWSLERTRQYLYRLSSLGRPAFYGESNWYGNPLFFWQRAWCTVFSGGVGVRPWNYISEAHMTLMAPLLRFTQKFRWAKITPQIGLAADNRVRSEAEIRYVADEKGTEIAIWAEGDAGTVVGVNGLSGDYTLEWFDPWDGEIHETKEVKIDKEFQTEIPARGRQKAMVLHLRK